jgi:thioredoxin reductase
MTAKQNFEVIIIGGSYAGLSAAMALGRSLRNVLIIDSGLPCNRQTPHSHNFITQDGEQPHVIAQIARDQVLKYSTVQFVEDRAVSGKSIENEFLIGTEKGQQYRAKKLIFATGIKDIMPDTKGFAACWGISVVHCPYCHGFELKGQKTGILANSAKAMHLASLVNNLTEDITIFTSGKAEFTQDELAKLNQHQIDIIETPIAELEHENGKIGTVILEDQTRLGVTALYASVPFTQHSDIPESLGCAITEHGYLSVDNFYKTSVKGIYACGDNSGMMRAVANAVYSGNFAGAMVNKELTDEQF